MTKHVRYAYDAFDRLLRRQVDADGDGVFESGAWFAYDGSDAVLVFDAPPGGGGGGSLTHRFLTDPASDAVFADQDALGEILWNLTDHQGTVRDVADYDAALDETSVVNHLTYSAFGAVTSQSDPALEPVQPYTGMYRDPETGLQKHGARWYDPDLGQWLSEDPIGFRAGEPNLRRYVGNNATNLVDPSGLAPPGPGTDIVNEALTGEQHGDVSQGGSDLHAGSQPSGTFSGATQGDIVPFAEAFGHAAEIIVAGQPQPMLRGPGAAGLGGRRSPTGRGGSTGSKGTVRPGTSAGADSLGTGARPRPLRPQPAHRLCDTDPFPTGVNTTRGWKVGDPINNLTKAGRCPSWSAVRQRFWKNEAYYNPSNYSSTNLDRMRRGLAPQRINPFTRRVESKELHHFPPQRDGGLFDVRPVWPDEHARIDPFRQTGN